MQREILEERSKQSSYFDQINDQNEKMEGFFERLVQNFEQLLVSKLKEQQEVFELRFEEQDQKRSINALNWGLETLGEIQHFLLQTLK